MSKHEMDEMERQVRELSAGFETLQMEYATLFGQQQTLERKLATARDQYNQLAKLYISTENDVDTPPLSLASFPPNPEHDPLLPHDALDILEHKGSSHSARTVRIARTAALALRNSFHRSTAPESSPDGVKIWAGPSADRPEREPSSSAMPVISESPLEQDFTIPGIPSRLGCPFASMAGKKLSSHAASVLSRYNQGSNPGAGPPSTTHSSVSRVNGRDSLSRRASRRASFADPIKAEICGLSEHRSEADVVRDGDKRQQHQHSQERQGQDPTQQQPDSTPKELNSNPSQSENPEPGVCPIRFLDQHSPEEVATYFERHKHELPRSHEICVKRYQSNEQQIRELDAKYGNMVSMIQGLGAKHKDMLPLDPDEEDVVEEDGDKAIDDAKVRKWASSVSAQAPASARAEDEGEHEEERQPHFERPLREIRVGESPSRPWGIPVPGRYVEEAEAAAERKPNEEPHATSERRPETRKAAADAPRAGKCPFNFDQPTPSPAAPHTPIENEVMDDTMTRPAIIAKPSVLDKGEPAVGGNHRKIEHQVVFTGPVFIGYGPEDAARFLRETGWSGK